MSLIIVASAIVGIAMLIALLAPFKKTAGGIVEYLVGGRSFPSWLIFILAVGEIYAIGVLLAYPGGVYAKGVTFGVWVMGYLSLAYVFGYFIAPLVWRAGSHYGALTLPDILYSHYASKALMVVASITLIITFLPWENLQFIGIQIVLESLGIHLSSQQVIYGAAALAFIYVCISGVRSPALVSYLKDFLMLAVIIVMAIIVLAFTGSRHAITNIPSHAVYGPAITGRGMVFTITTIIFQAVVFYLCIGVNYVLPGKSEGAVKKTMIWMPLYMLLYPALTIIAIYGVENFRHVANANTIFMVISKNILPPWGVGIVAGAAIISGLVVISFTALLIGGVVSRNLIPQKIRNEKQTFYTKLAVAVFLLLGALMTVYEKSLMLSVLNVFYAFQAQVAVAIACVLFIRRANPAAITLGMIVGVVVSIILFHIKDIVIFGINKGVVATFLNIMIVVVWRIVSPSEIRNPVSSWRISA